MTMLSLTTFVSITFQQASRDLELLTDHIEMHRLHQLLLTKYHAQYTREQLAIITDDLSEIIQAVDEAYDVGDRQLFKAAIQELKNYTPPFPPMMKQAA